MNMVIFVRFLLIFLNMAIKTEATWNYIKLRGHRTDGQIEVKISGSWGLICRTNWSMTDATVACRQLGFDGAKKKIAATVPTNGRHPVVISKVRCNGTETNLLSCNHTKVTRRTPCKENSTASVTCITPIQRPPADNSPCKLNQYLCKNKNMCIPQAWICNGQDDCGNNEDEMSCIPAKTFPNQTMSVRLEGSAGPSVGRLEILFSNTWGTVCNDGFSKRSADVVCRQLGFRSAKRVYRNTTQLRRGPIWMDNVRCIGNESSILECKANPLGIHDCEHSEDVWISCLPLQGCGVQQFPIIKSSYRIVGGEPVTKGSWPWQAALLITLPSGDKEPYCGGVLVDREWVLTAAHCFDSMKNLSLSAIRVRLGDHDMPRNEGTEQEFSILQLLKHPHYMQERHFADLALIKLDRPANTASRYVQKICLPKNNTTPFTGSDYCFVTGWGDTRGTGDKNILQQVRVPVFSYMDCRHMYGRKILRGMFCAGYDMGGKDACQGDSGGPLMCKRDNRWLVAGIVSWGEGCGRMNKPGVYTEVRSYINWITDSIHPPLNIPPIINIVFGRK